MPTLLLTALLGVFPFLFLFPDVIQVGGTFIRGDYLLLPFGALLLLHRFAFLEKSQPFAGYTASVLPLLLGFPLLTAIQLLWIPEQVIDTAGAVKYALWPLKMAVWGLCMRELFIAHPDPLKAIYNLFAVLVVLVFGLQIVELVSTTARLQMLEWYPIAAVERVSQITFRARAVFNGFDTASMFYLLSAVVLTNLKPHVANRNNLVHAGLILLCVGGALVSARTGALLLMGYLTVALWNRGSPARKLALVASILWAVSCVLLLGFDSVSGSEGSLLGRYLELMNVVASGGDMLAVNSFWGTFEMNATALGDSAFNFWLGIGLNTSTTADQLYAKYLVMFGVVGLVLWSVVHMGLLWGLRAKPNAAGAPLKAACMAYGLLVILAHVKGGNYFFAQRLGELTTLVFMMAYTADYLLKNEHAKQTD